MSLSTHTDDALGTEGSTQRFHGIVERDKKKVPVASATDLAIKILLLVPVWMVLVLPLTIFYQVGKSVLNGIGDKQEPEQAAAAAAVQSMKATTASGNEPEDTSQSLPTDFVPRPDRSYDVVVLGATGFTGGLAVRHLADTYGVGKTVKWAVAGRSASKLDAVLESLADDPAVKNFDASDAERVDRIVCDTSDLASLSAMVRNTRSVATTAGPFSLYGGPLVERCARYGTHYADITGETSFVKKMKAEHQDMAIATGARILSLCGNDCVPWDLSYNILADEFAERCTNNNRNPNVNDNETMVRIEFGNEFSSSASGGTLKTMCLGISGKLADPSELDPAASTLLRRPFGSSTEHTSPMENNISFGIKTGVSKPWEMVVAAEDDRRGGVTAAATDGTDGKGSKLVEAPFVMSGVNYESVGWSHALRRDKKCSYKEQLLLPDFITALDGVLGLLLFFTSLMNPITGRLLEDYLVTQPGDGPAMEQMNNDFFLALTGTAYGSKGSVYQSLLYYDKDPGYLETARMVVECALCLALEEEAVSENIAGATLLAKNVDAKPLPEVVGGFFTPGFALRKILLRRLVDTGCHYEFRVLNDALK